MSIQSQELVSVARATAYSCRNDHEYLPQTPEDAKTFEPHDWVIEAMAVAYHMGLQGATFSRIH